ncbi:MAG: hypothetical protein MUO76_14440 [Anaerolineaceae bacterium]|nr:hypothetical protein [Anaerolineaceae bacterium]
MITLRCTQKLRKYLGIVLVEKPEPATAVLGDWYANLIPTFSGDLIIFVNEKTLLTVAVPVWESDNLIPQFCLRVANLLGMIGIHPKVIADEISHLDNIQFAKTASRSVLGSMNDFAAIYQIVAEGSDMSLSNAELNLSQTPCKPLGYSVPAEAAKELLNTMRKNAS